MVNYRWTGRGFFTNIRTAFMRRMAAIQLAYRTLFHNYFFSQSYLADTLMEPMFWFVDNFTKFLGPFFVAAVCALTAFVVGVAYIIGVPYWWNRNPYMLSVLLVIGHWLLLNICFHFYMACITSPGYPPQGKLITEAVSICRKCISPKPPRTHHCSICDRCVLKMDHHCPWLNNCVGHSNHRYFFLYMVFMVAGCGYLMLFGCELAFQIVFGEGEVRELGEEELELIGHPVRLNHSKLVPMREMMKNGSYHPLPSPFTEPPRLRNWPRTFLIFTALIVCGVFAALGSLMLWHSRLISRGETSIESHINSSETKRLAALNKNYENPYNFGTSKNWRIFLGMTNGRGWRHVLLPSSHPAEGNGLFWPTVAGLDDIEVATEKEK